MGAGFLHSQRRSAGRRVAAPVAAAIAGAALLCGCGHSAPAKKAAAHHGSRAPGVCAPAALDAMARTLAVKAASIATGVSTASNAMPQCAFSTRLRHGRSVEVTVNVDNGPQPYFVLERTIVEASQTFTAQRASPAPVAVPGLGLEASWFPAETHLEVTDGFRLITATVDWPGATQTREIALARAMAAPYLKTPHGKEAQALAKGYPSSVG
jgi:hypothetical protein